MSLVHRIRGLLRRALNIPGWESRDKTYPAASQWGQFFVSLTARERLILIMGVALIVVGTGIAGARSYLSHTDILPSKGGTITVGVVGRPLYINPVLAQSNAADLDLERLLFAGLFRYSPDGTLIPEIAESYAIGDLGKVVEVTIRDGLRWPDGEPVTADDVQYTIESIQNPTIRSPLLATWTGIQVDVIDMRLVRFTLPAPYPPFLHNLTIGILPKHAWEDVAPENFALNEMNLEPMGLGPFRPIRIDRTKAGRVLSYTLERNPAALRTPLLDSVVLRFFDQRQEAIVAFNRREINLLGPLRPQDPKQLRAGAMIVTASLPRTFGLFFNQVRSKVLSDDDVRRALTHATDRTPLIEILGGQRFVTGLEMPVPEGMFGATTESRRFGHNLQEALSILEEAEWLFPPPAESTNGDESGTESGNTNEEQDKAEQPAIVGPIEAPIREDGDGNRLAIIITHRQDPTIQAVASTLKSQWEALGADIELRSLTTGAFRKAIIERDYEVLLAGEELPLDPDLFAFWHSSQKFDPGGNLALFESPSVDAILERARETFEDDAREQLYQDAQKLMYDDAPAVFLWQERYSTAVDPAIHGITLDLLANPSWRFANVHEWYVRTKRVWR